MHFFLPLFHNKKYFIQKKIGIVLEFLELSLYSSSNVQGILGLNALCVLRYQKNYEIHIHDINIVSSSVK